MAELEAQLRAYTMSVLDRFASVDADELVVVEPSRDHQNRARRRRPVVVLLVALLVSALGAVLWFGARDDAPRVTTGAADGSLPTHWSGPTTVPGSFDRLIP